MDEKEKEYNEHLERLQKIVDCQDLIEEYSKLRLLSSFSTWLDYQRKQENTILNKLKNEKESAENG